MHEMEINLLLTDTNSWNYPVNQENIENNFEKIETIYLPIL